MLKYVKSDDIFFTKGTGAVGAGMGQVLHVDVVEFAAVKAKEYAEGKDAQGTVMTSDALFSLSGGVEKTIDAGIEAAIQPGSSMSDEDAIAACNERGIAMIFTR